MTLDEITRALLLDASRIATQVTDAEWYLFGSVLRSADLAADIDVLVLCNSHEDVTHVRASLTDRCVSLPLHLFLVTRQEERELGFIAGQGCMRIYPLDFPPVSDYYSG